MAVTPAKGTVGHGWRLPLFKGMLPLERSRVLGDVVAGVTLAAMNIPQALGYARIAGTPVITGLYTLLLPVAGFATLGASRYLVVAADSATAVIVATGVSAFAVAVRLVDIGGLRLLRRNSPGEFALAVVTAAAVVFVGVEDGILLAMVLSLLQDVRHGYRPNTAIIVHDAIAEPTAMPPNC